MPITNNGGVTRWGGKVTINDVLNRTAGDYFVTAEWSTIELDQRLEIEEDAELFLAGLVVNINDKVFTYVNPSNPSIIKGVCFIAPSNSNHRKILLLAIEDCGVWCGRNGNDAISVQSFLNSQFHFRNSGATSGNDRAGVLSCDQPDFDKTAVYRGGVVNTPIRVMSNGLDELKRQSFYWENWFVDMYNGTERELILGGNNNPEMMFVDVTVHRASAIKCLFYNSQNRSDGHKAILIFAGTSVDSFFRSGPGVHIPLSFHNNNHGSNRIVLVGGVKYWKIKYGDGMEIYIDTTENVEQKKYCRNTELDIPGHQAGFLTGNIKIQITENEQNVQFFVPMGEGNDRRFYYYGNMPSAVVRGYNQIEHRVEYTTTADAIRTEGSYIEYATIDIYTDEAVTELNKNIVSAYTGIEINGVNITVAENITIEQLYDFVKNWWCLPAQRYVKDLPVIADGMALTGEFHLTITADGGISKTDKFNKLSTSQFIVNNGESDCILEDRNGTRSKLILTGLKEDTEVRVYAGDTEIMGVESIEGDFVGEYLYTGQDIEASVVIFNKNYNPVKLELSLKDSIITLPITQIYDRVYK